MLKKKELTIKEIADNTEFNENQTRVYIHRLLNDNLIKEIGKKNRYIIYAAVEKEDNILDTQILKKMILPFIKNNIELDLENNEIERIKNLFQEVNIKK